MKNLQLGLADIIPHLSERGRIELDLATAYASNKALMDHVSELEAEIADLRMVVDTFSLPKSEKDKSNE